jgi:molecular chaperone Hsp33
MHDILQRFIFEETPVRGEIVNLEQSWQEILQRHQYPAVLRPILGELVAAASLLAANLKFDGTLVMQMHGTGCVKLIVVECTSDLTIRATAKWEGEVPAVSLQELLGNGKFVITIDPKNDAQAYQGIVALEGDSVAEIITHYMLHSEQLETRLWLSANDGFASGMLLQRMPGSVAEQDDWDRITMLADTVKPEELNGLDSTTLLYRLFNEEDVRLFEAEHLHFACTCSADRVGSMIQLLGQEEADTILEEQGEIKVHCEFCNQCYVFDAIDVAALFSGSVLADTVKTRQ